MSESRITRRELLRGGLAATALVAVAGAGVGVGEAAAIPPIKRTRPSHFKLSLAAYSYRQMLAAKPPTMDLFGFADRAADMGLDAIEPTSYYFPKDVDDAYLRKLQRHAFLLGLDISGTAIGNNFCLPVGPARAEQLALTRTWIDRAAVLNAPVIRIFAGNVRKGDTEADAFRYAVENLREALAYAETKGVILALENHGGITAKPEQLLKLVEAVDHPYFGVNLDSGNFHGKDPYKELELLAPFAVNVQVKTEIKREGSKTKEDADLARIVEILRAVRYSGYIVLEYEAAPDPLQAIPGHIETLKKLIR